jgi:hypothetical protein
VTSGDPPQFDQRLKRRDALMKEVDYRRDRRAAIVTWSTSVLVGLTGGITFINVQSQELSAGHRVILSFAVLVFGLFAAAWWEDQRQIGREYKRRLEELDETMGWLVTAPDPLWSRLVGGLVAILLLTVAALASIWVR